MPRTGTPSLAHGCQLTACLSLQRARVERRGFENDFRALESFRLAMIWRADRRGRNVCDANGNSQARPGRTPVDGEMRHNGRCGTHPRRYAARAGEPSQGFRFAFLIPSPARAAGGRGQGEVGPMICAQHPKQFPWHHRADTCAACLAPSIRTVQPAAWPDSSVCRLSIPFHCGYRDSASITLHSEVIKSDETG